MGFARLKSLVVLAIKWEVNEPEGLLRSCHNDFHRPVLKHGPRSQTLVRVCGWKTHRRSESEFRMPRSNLAASAAHDLL